MKIFIIDQHNIVIDGLRSILTKKRGFDVAGSANSIDDAISWLQENETDLIITEIQFPENDITNVIKFVKENHPETKILILTGENRIKKVNELFKLGINGFIEKHQESKKFIDALNTLNIGGSYIGSELRERIISAFSNMEQDPNEIPMTEILGSITNRELEIIRLICDGFNSKEISSKLFISFNTVETHRKRIFQKLKIKNSIALIRFALKHDLVE